MQAAHHVWSVPLGSRRVDGHSYSRNLASYVVCLVARRIVNRFGKRTAERGTARGQSKCFDENNSAEQHSCRGVVVQSIMIDLVSGAAGFLPNSEAEILLSRRTRPGILNFGLIAVKLDISEVELSPIREGWIAGGVALGNQLETPHPDE